MQGLILFWYTRIMSVNSPHLYLHADGDSFFASCEIAHNPSYKGKAVIVGEDRGIVVAMSYEAKMLGITRGMPLFKLKKQFSNLVILPHNFELYKKISHQVYDILLSYVRDVEVYSIDECFARITLADIRHAGSVKKFVEDIKKEIEDTLGVTYSFGVAQTKALAKTASKLHKPNGVTLLLTPLEEEQALKKTNIKDVWGIGRRTLPRLLLMGIKTAYDFAHYSQELIETHFTEPIILLQKELSGQSCMAFDTDPDPRDQKSIQSTATFKPSSNDFQIIFAELSENIEHACQQARRLSLMTNFISFYLKTAKFTYHGKEQALPYYTSDPTVILNTVETLLVKEYIPSEKIRAIGITLHNLHRVEAVPRDLFGKQDSLVQTEQVEIVADQIRQSLVINI